jgi:hypothetical protein
VLYVLYEYWGESLLSIKEKAVKEKLVPFVFVQMWMGEVLEIMDFCERESIFNGRVCLEHMLVKEAQVKISDLHLCSKYEGEGVFQMCRRKVKAVYVGNEVKEDGSVVGVGNAFSKVDVFSWAVCLFELVFLPTSQFLAKLRKVREKDYDDFMAFFALVEFPYENHDLNEKLRLILTYSLKKDIRIRPTFRALRYLWMYLDYIPLKEAELILKGN